MVSKILGLLNKRFSSLHQTALLLIGSSLASQLLGLLRDRLLAHTFGASRTLDIYYAAFKVPDFLFVTIASLVSLTILIPFLASYLAKGQTKEAREFMDSLISGFLGVMLIATLIAFFLMPYLARLVVPGFSGAEVAEFVLLSRILLLSPILLGLSNHLGSITQSFQKFFVYALTPLLYNIGIIFGVIVLYPAMGLTGLVWGVVLGALMQSLIQLPAIAESGFLPRLTFRINTKAIAEVVRVCVPRTITLSASQLVLIVITALASLMTVGSVAIFNFSFNLQSVLIAVGVSYSVAAFPTLSRLYAENKRDEFKGAVATAARHILFWTLPAAALFVVLRAQIVRTVLGSGRFDWTSTRLVAAALALFAISVVAQALILLLIRAFYAAGKTKIPLLVTGFASLVTIALAWLGAHYYMGTTIAGRFFEALFRVSGLPGTDVLMLPLAFAVGQILNVTLLIVFFEKEFGGTIKMVGRTFLHTLSAGIIAAFVAYKSLSLFDNLFDLATLQGIFLQGLCAGIIGIIIGIIILLLVQNAELSELLGALREKFSKAKAVLPGQEEQLHS